MNQADIASLVQRASGRADSLRRLPESTYRLQFHRGFTFADATAIIPYLAQLRITHVYSSPYLRSTPGSTHGYDVIDHCRLNPEYGDQSDFDGLIKALADHDMSHILDTVPNHAGVATNENHWWNDVLEHGPASWYGSYFDIAWRDSPRPELHDRVLVPILGESYAKVLEQGQLQLSFDEEAGSFSISYFKRKFPVNPSSYPKILALRPGDDDELSSILTELANLPGSSERDKERIAVRTRETAIIKRRLAILARGNAVLRGSIDSSLKELNGTPGDPRSFDALDELLSAQSYRLAFWRVASEEINYRRFFDINDLAAMAMERPDVFEETHALTLQLLAEGKVTGLRIDHPDGLYDPEKYFQRLQSHYLLACARAVAAADPAYAAVQWSELKVEVLADIEREKRSRPPLYVVAEKIVAMDERLPREWEIDGTSGYRFLNMINGLFVDSGNADAFTRLYGELGGNDTTFEDLIYRKKRLVLDTAMASELHMLTHRLGKLAEKNRRSIDFTHTALRGALAEVIACFSVYRTYISGPTVSEVDRDRIDMAIQAATARNPRIEPDLFAFIRETLLQKFPENFSDADRAQQIAFAGKFQQLTSPVTAKGVEDTAFYIFNRLISLNEVGGDPARFGIAPDALHTYLSARQKSWPHALSAMSTHDTKRSEDVRARLNVLSELPGDWRDCVIQWKQLNGDCPLSANEQYLLYQSLVGAWPLEPYSHDEFEAFIKRIQAYVLKAMREAKVSTSWTEPNGDCEKAADTFIARILNDDAFVSNILNFVRRLAPLGLINSLSQTVLKLASPGVPDTYQGMELWDFSLVDPDNRRPVDFARRRHVVDELHATRNSHRENLSGLAKDLMHSMNDGRVKFWITWQMLEARRDHPGLFSEGEYLPIKTTGTKANHLFAFARHFEDRTALVIVPRLLGRVGVNPEAWMDTQIVLPDGLAGKRFRNIFTGVTIHGPAAKDLLADLPAAVLVAQD